VESLGSAKAMISIYSTTLYEVVFWGVPAISYSYIDEEIPQISNAYDFGLWFDARSKEELAFALEDILKKGPLFRNQIRARKAFFQRRPYCIDGKTQQRLEKIYESLS